MDPRNTWLSKNFRVSDFLGNHSVYALGRRNRFEGLSELQLANAQALCEYALEPLIAARGPVSISYGYISAEFSRATVKYQDPDIPSHHRWDLGAAADVRVHSWIESDSSPIELAHVLAESNMPFSRMITYSESPCLCLAVSAAEVESGSIRRAFYENRYMGVPGAKPLYLRYANEASRQRAAASLRRDGLPHPWRGAGYPTYHGGGFRQYQHTPASRYSTVLDWLFNLRSVQEGIRNPPCLDMAAVQDAFVAAGALYDHVVGQLFHGFRVPILQGFTARSHPDFTSGVSWFDGRVRFELGAPQHLTPVSFCKHLQKGLQSDYITVRPSAFGAFIDAGVDGVIEDFFPEDA